ncbi:right-handed parallel beta-helix repeat-containing protein [Sphaerisporangium aureirubrum]|uniref:Right handed beta helix domain-containing protein n=1 Tax=Sphaerisporangium aureirubrum TaxID=1544736 RepID=A0ABW1ND82_9ACTN
MSLPLISVLLADPAARPLPEEGALARAGASQHAAGASYASRTYYVDASRGDDDAPGTSPKKAWRSLARAGERALRPGDTLLLRRGGRWKGTLELKGKGTAARPVVVGAYGSGARPRITSGDDDCVVVTGSYIRVSELRASRCGWAGFRVEGRHNDLWDVYADRNVTGVWITPGGARNVLRNSQVAGNDRMSVDDDAPDNDSGAFGVLLNGDDNRVVGNLITGSYARSHDYVADGAAVEVYGGDRNVVAHNVARDNETFAELGHAPGGTATGNLFAHNVVTSTRPRGSFLITRGSGHSVGPVRGTVAVHNSVYLPARTTIGFSCADGCSGRILTLRNNVVRVGGTIGFEDGSGIDDAGGVYDGKLSDFSPGRRSVRADPRFRSRRDLRLRAGSPAIGRGVPLGPSWFGGAGLAYDAAGRAIPRAKNPDAGAYQY